MSELLEGIRRIGREVESPVAQAVLVIAVAFALLVGLSVLRRLLAPVSPLTLLRTRCHEIVPVRGLVGVVHGVLWIGSVAAIVAALRSGWLAWQVYDRRHTLDRELAVAAAVAVVAAVVLRGLRRGWRDRVLHVDPGAPPAVRVRVDELVDRFPHDRLETLGAERFPNRVAPGWRAGMWGRALFAVLLGGVAWLAFAHADDRGVVAAVRGQLAVLWMLPAELHGVSFAVAYIGAALFAIALFTNRHYLLLPFGRMQLAVGASALSPLAALAVHHGPTALLQGAGCAAGLWSLRMVADLRLALRYRRRARVYEPVSAAIAEQVPWLAKLHGDAGCELPALDLGALGERVTRGVKNIEEAGELVTRSFGRYMRRADAAHRPCAVATLRFMTVRRYVELAGGWGTYAGLRWPQVPAWDEARFPLNVPRGYVNWLDPLPLGQEWNVVKTCARCGGSGQVQETYYETEYYTEYVDGRSVQRTRQVARTRMVTCGICGGSGRTEHQQVLCTQWARLLPAHTEPALRMPELVEDAEEVTWFRRPLVENRARWTGGSRSSIADPALQRSVAASADALAAVHDGHAQAVTELLGGVLYRSELAVAGFHLVNIRFGLLRRTGWFFGRRPEFYFPRLPLGWATLWTWVLLPPVALACWGLAVAACAAWVTGVGAAG
ncbi:MAG: hypothetical protein IPM29_15780 [Planctomycetes bacterium]|nr:hypothetical protein [Planctomycetota bacterium]